jgi:hypothetical protein
MVKPFDRVLTCLSYICGPLIEDWVNAHEQDLSDRVDVTKANHVMETNKVLWTEFTTAFADTWKDTRKKQNTYEQLMRLQMNGWDINTYIATFEKLAAQTKWSLLAEGTIACFQDGLNRMIHSKALNRDKIPRTMDEWKATA